MTISRKQRHEVWQKYNGHCAYCGCELRYEEMQVDHFIPAGRGLTDEQMNYAGGRGQDDMANYMPACRMCNFYKDRNTLEMFRRKIAQWLDYKRTFATRLALRYGILTEHAWDGKFYFEKQEKQNGDKTTKEAGHTGGH